MIKDTKGFSMEIANKSFFAFPLFHSHTDYDYFIAMARNVFLKSIPNYGNLRIN